MPQFKLLEKADNRLKQIAYLVNDIRNQVKLKNVCFLPVCMWKYCATRLTNALGHTVSIDFIDTTFLRSSAAKLQLCSIHMCRYIFRRWPKEHVTSKLLHRSKYTNYQETK